MRHVWSLANGFLFYLILGLAMGWRALVALLQWLGLTTVTQKQGYVVTISVILLGAIVSGLGRRIVTRPPVAWRHVFSVRKLMGCLLIVIGYPLGFADKLMSGGEWLTYLGPYVAFIGYFLVLIDGDEAPDPA